MALAAYIGCLYYPGPVFALQHDEYLDGVTIMKKLHIGLGLIFGVMTPEAWAESSAELFQQLCASVHNVRAVAPSGRTYLGSSVLVAPGRAVTNCHVVREASSIKIGRGSYEARGEAVAEDLPRDICIVAAPTAQGRVSPVRSASSLSIGETVYAAGYSGGVRASISEGQVVALHPYADGHVIQVSAQFGLGASGGGLFDGQGRLVGILTFYRPTDDGGIFFALPVDWAEKTTAREFKVVAPLSGPAPFWAEAEGSLPAFLRR